jgi:hypothetical protein
MSCFSQAEMPSHYRVKTTKTTSTHFFSQRKIVDIAQNNLTNSLPLATVSGSVQPTVLQPSVQPAFSSAAQLEAQSAAQLVLQRMGQAVVCACEAGRAKRLGV